VEQANSLTESHDCPDLHVLNRRAKGKSGAFWVVPGVPCTSSGPRVAEAA